MILFVKSPNLFLVRHHTGRYLKRTNPDDVDHINWSTRLLHRLSVQWKEVVIFNDIDLESERVPTWPGVSISLVIHSLGFTNIYVVNYHSTDMTKAMEIWKRSIMSRGGSWKTPMHPSYTNYLMLDVATQSNTIKWAGADGNGELDIAPDKLNSFWDLAKDRESNSIW